MLHFDEIRYQLLGWCVMPTHVHVLVVGGAEWPLDRLVHTWKSFTANQANRVLGRSGRFWAPEYFDRLMRDDGEVELATSYIENNPVVAGLCRQAAEWPWSSAGARASSLKTFEVKGVVKRCGLEARAPGARHASSWV